MRRWECDGIRGAVGGWMSGQTGEADARTGGGSDGWMGWIDEQTNDCWVRD